MIERCAGHGGTFGVMKETHKVTMKIGRPVMRQMVAQARSHRVGLSAGGETHPARRTRDGGKGWSIAYRVAAPASDRDLRPRLRAHLSGVSDA